MNQLEVDVEDPQQQQQQQQQPQQPHQGLLQPVPSAFWMPSIDNDSSDRSTLGLDSILFTVLASSRSSPTGLRRSERLAASQAQAAASQARYKWLSPDKTRLQCTLLLKLMDFEAAFGRDVEGFKLRYAYNYLADEVVPEVTVLSDSLIHYFAWSPPMKNAASKKFKLTVQVEEVRLAADKFFEKYKAWRMAGKMHREGTSYHFSVGVQCLEEVLDKTQTLSKSLHDHLSDAEAMQLESCINHVRTTGRAAAAAAAARPPPPPDSPFPPPPYHPPPYEPPETETLV